MNDAQHEGAGPPRPAAATKTAAAADQAGVSPVTAWRGEVREGDGRWQIPTAPPPV
jgi:hypothetical protein